MDSDVFLKLAFVGTLNSFGGGGGIWEIKTSNITKEEISEGNPLRVTTPSRTCETVPEVEPDDSWLVILSMAS